MRVSKVGIASLLIGLVLLLGIWYALFYSPSGGVVDSVISAIVVIVEGGLMLLGILLIVIGILMLVI